MQHRLFSAENAVGWRSCACGPPTASLSTTNGGGLTLTLSSANFHSWRRKACKAKLLIRTEEHIVSSQTLLKIHIAHQLLLIGNKNSKSSLSLHEAHSMFMTFAESVGALNCGTVVPVCYPTVNLSATSQFCNYQKWMTYSLMSLLSEPLKRQKVCLLDLSQQYISFSCEEGTLMTFVRVDRQQ